MLLSFQRPSRLAWRGLLLKACRAALRLPERAAEYSAPERLPKEPRDALSFPCAGNVAGIADDAGSGFRPMIWTCTDRSRGRSSKSIRTTCCQVPEHQAPAHERDAQRRPQQRRAQVRVRVVVVVEPVVGVVAALGPAPRHQPLDRLLQVLHPAGLVLHRRDRGRRAGHEHRHDAVRHLRGAQRGSRPAERSTISPSPAVCRRSSALWTAISAVGSRRKRRLPTCSTRPSSSATAKVELGHRLAVEAHAALGDVAPGLRARHRRTCSARSSGRWTTPSAGVEHDGRHVLGHLARDVDAVEGGLGLRRGGLAVEAGHERARERALGVARRDALRRRRAEQQVVPARHRGVGDRERLAVHLGRRVGDADVVAERLRHLLARRRCRPAAARSARPAAACRRRTGSRGPSAG